MNNLAFPSARCAFILGARTLASIVHSFARAQEPLAPSRSYVASMQGIHYDLVWRRLWCVDSARCVCPHDDDEDGFGASRQNARFGPDTDSVQNKYS